MENLSFLILRHLFFCDNIDKHRHRDGLAVRRTEGIDLHTQFLFAAWNPDITATHLWVAAAVLACVLAAELVGIGALIGKLVSARRQSHVAELDPAVESEQDLPLEEEDAPQEETGSYQYAALAPIVLTTAIPKITYSVLTGLFLAVAVAAVVLLSLLIVGYAVGFDYAKKKKADKPEEPILDADQPENIEYEAPAETAEGEAAPVYAEVPSYEGDEYLAQETYVAAEEAATTDEEEQALVAEEQSEAVSGDVVPVDTITTVIRTSEAIPPVDGQGPYKVVEKIVTETYKEVIKEVPAADTQKSTNADEVLEKLSNFLEYELEKRKAADAAADAESVPAFARSEERLTAEDLDDEDDDDEDESEDAVDGEGTADDDTDDEENDIADDRFTGNERIIGFDDATGCYIVAHYRKSFEAKLIQARPNIKKYYSDLKNALLSYKGTKSRVSWTADSFHNGRSPLAKINVKTRILEIYLALDPATLEGTVYRGKDVGNKKKYADTPFQYKIRTPRKFKWAMELVQRVCEEHGLTPIDIEPVAYDEQYPFDTTENLVERKLIKEYIRQEKPASTFELADDHVPALPDEDASVIPANANFSWELDNDKMSDPAHDPEPVEIPETETPVAQPVTEEAKETEEKPATPVYKETVKVTEVRYTEHYYANGDVTTVMETKETDAPAQLTDGTAEEHEAAEETATEIFFDEFDTEAGADKFGDADPFAAYRGEIEIEEPEETEEVEYEEVEVEEAVEEAEETEEEEEEAAIAWSELAEVEEEAEEVEEETPVEEDVEVVYEYVYVDEDGNEIPYVEGELPEGYEEIVEEVEEEIEVEEEAEEPAPTRPRDFAQPSNPEQALIDIRRLEENFPDGAVINLEKLKSVGMVSPEARTLQIYAGGSISKAFTVEADVFTIDAMKYIDDANGNIVVIRKQGGFGK